MVLIAAYIVYHEVDSSCEVGCRSDNCRQAGSWQQQVHCWGKWLCRRHDALREQHNFSSTWYEILTMNRVPPKYCQDICNSGKRAEVQRHVQCTSTSEVWRQQQMQREKLVAVVTYHLDDEHLRILIASWISFKFVNTSSESSGVEV